MNILITGGTGLIGQQLIIKLGITKANITVLTRDITKAAQKLPSKITFIKRLSLCDVEKQDIVINLAGEPIADRRWTHIQKQKICDSRWKITEQLTALIKEAKSPPHLFISGSAIGIYGRQSDTPIEESYTEFHQEFTHHVCATWEDLALRAQSPRTRVAILRTGIVLAKNGGALSKMLLPFKLGLGGKIGTGQQIMSWIHIEDMVNAILHIKDTPSLEGVINLTSGKAVSNKVFTAMLSKTLNRPHLFNTPAFVLKFIFGEMSELLLFGQNVIPSKLKNSGFIFKYPSIDSALNNLLK
jgi:uncharacterized protein (TIGR01777 family)